MGCCDGLTCVEDNPFYSQCRYVPPTAAPVGSNTPAPTKRTTSSPTKSPSSRPTPLPTESTLSPTDGTNSPTETPEGCFSNNYKTCLPDSYETPANITCTLTWLPRGAEKNCLALWDECTNASDSCCGAAECYGDSEYATCVPKNEVETEMPSISPSNAPSISPSNAPSISPTNAPSSSPTLPTCIVCDDVPTGNMIDRGETCEEANNIDNKCAKDNWINKKFCQLTCYNTGNGYEGDVCCNGSARKLLRAGTQKRRS